MDAAIGRDPKTPEASRGNRLGIAPPLSYSPLMTVTLTKELETLVRQKVRSGRYADASDVVRDALRRMEEEDSESPALEAALLEGVRSPHRPWGKASLSRIRKAARNSK